VAYVRFDPVIASFPGPSTIFVATLERLICGTSTAQGDGQVFFIHLAVVARLITQAELGPAQGAFFV